MNSETTYLTDLAAVLWPCGGLLGRGGGLLGRGGLPARGGDPTLPRDRTVPRDARRYRVREYLPVPSAHNPRVILPVANRYVATRGITAFSHRHTLRDRLRTTVLTAAFTSGLAPFLLRDRLHVGSGFTIEHALSSALDREVLVAIHLGPPRASRKPVLLLLTPAGRAVGYAKVGINDLTSRLVTAETRALRRLAHSRLQGITAPRLLHVGEWNGCPLLVQEALPVGHNTDRPNRRQLLRYVLRIAHLAPVSEHPLSRSPYLETLTSRIDALSARPEAPALRSALAQLPDVRVPFGAWHGDFTRWNIAATARRAFVWDWERLTFGVPVGFDALHYELNECVQAGVRPGVQQWLDRGIRLLRDPLMANAGIPNSAVSTVMALYLIDLATRYLHDRQAEGGGRLPAVDDWLLPALNGLGERAAREAPRAG
ncbi:phosphotransferase [Halostreptopolyspora alba]|uniref:Aminoglycoside phosphotransferase n=1 Tax=Halostreptopolyspora alba TaxID=2487137 RepID=A0A3N0E4S9_9ACTN|nr:aminoglycoside phosphotransferase [Nocardiopsaceae bacterium YIM 96095]